jgi:hypothetical protein
MSKIGEISFESEGRDLFVTVDGLRIAKRGAKEWISLVPGWSVVDYVEGDDLGVEVSFEGERFTLH